MKSNRDNSMFMPYPGMNMNANMPQGMYPMMPRASDIDNRLNSIERQLKRLDTRISRLEGNTGAYSNDSSYNTSLNDNYQNMYPNAMHMM